MQIEQDVLKTNSRRVVPVERQLHSSGVAPTALSAAKHTLRLMASGSNGLRSVGLFAGIGGIERGLARAGIDTELLCESWEPAQRVLTRHWPSVELRGDIRDLRSLPKTDVLSAGFPCTDLSQAGRMAGITGSASGLVGEVFRLLRSANPTWLVLENVRNMLVLDGGTAMRYLVDELESHGYRWAYRVVDSRSFGVSQRRQRVVLVASRTMDPRQVLFADEAGEPGQDWYRSDAFGFYWTEGLTGLGWARDAVPTLKGGSTLGIPSPPAIWLPQGEPGRRLLTPRIEDAESLQGFPRGWTKAAVIGRSVNGPRWKLVGNAVTVGVSQWLGRRLIDPGEPVTADDVPLRSGDKWPLAAWGERGRAFRVEATIWPVKRHYRHLTSVVDVTKAKPVSARGVAGFKNRMDRSSLRFDPQFREDVAKHLHLLETTG
jgi:DNA (cytosine-5)-methyltransferase 1